MAYDATKPLDDGYLADAPAELREQHRALKDDKIVNAGKLNGYTQGNTSGKIPLNNGTLNVNLNADMLDGHDSAYFSADGHVHSGATTSANGFMTTTQVTKLNGIATGAEVNQNTFANVKVGSSTIQADGKTDTLTLAAGNAITLTADTTNDKVTIAVTSNTFLPLAGGTMSGGITFSEGASSTSGTYAHLHGTMAANDSWRIASGATASNAGFLEISTANDGNEPIYIRQFTGAFATLKRTATLLDGSGNTSFPGTVTVSGAVAKSGFTGSYVGEAKTGSIVRSDPPSFGGIATAKTKNGRVVLATYPSNDDKLLVYYISNTKIDADTNSADKTWSFDGSNGNFTAASFNGYTISKSVPSDAVFTDTHWTSHLYAGTSSGTAHASTTNGNTHLILCDNSTARNRVKITGSGATTVTSDANGVITIHSTDNNTVYTHPTSAGNKHIPAGGSSGQILRWSAAGTAAWGADNNTTYSAGHGLALSSTTFRLAIPVCACSTAAGTAAKVASVSSGTFALNAGAMALVNMTYDNRATANLTLNIGSTGAKNVYGPNMRGRCLVLYDGSAYRLIQVAMTANSKYSPSCGDTCGHDE